MLIMERKYDNVDDLVNRLKRYRDKMIENIDLISYHIDDAEGVN